MSVVNPAYARNAYTRATVTTNTPLDLIIMLYSGVIEYLERAAHAIENKDLQTKIKCIDKAIAIINELSNSLNSEDGGEITANLESLYLYMSKELVLANIKNDSGKIDHIASLLRTIQEGWLDIKSRNPEF
ncbi:MAG: Flagellar protein FliS [Syntrophorhabdus sp. PtaU1.Bin058]|nr:MAG: Flagellar protein FliS [Syntrophorhabdus sp. PtaU1.Bin058]